jgi:hypothetical protein
MEWLLLLIPALIAWYGSSMVKICTQISRDVDEMKLRMFNIDLALKHHAEEINAQIAAESWALQKIIERNPNFRNETTDKHEV